MRVVVPACWFYCAAAFAAPATEPDADYAAGIALYRAGQYEAALRAFEQARAAGMATAHLEFNLGLVCAKLRRDDEARVHFERLLLFPDFVSLAQYQLGLIAERQGDRESARVLMAQVEADAANDVQRALAHTASQRLAQAPASPLIAAAAFASLGGGWDSNPVLTSDDAGVGPEPEGDPFAELLAVGSVPLAGDARVGWIGEGSAYVREYASLPDMDLATARLGVRFQRSAGRDRFSVIGSGETAFFGGDVLQSVGALAGEWRHQAAGTTAVTVEIASIAGGHAYEDLDGLRARASLQYTRRIPVGRLKGIYDVEYNDRDDLRAGEAFLSRSPLRQRLGARWNADLSARWSTEMGARFRHSRYADPDTRFSEGVPVTRRRVEDLSEGSIGLRYQLYRQWSLLAQYTFQHNRSNFADFDYDRHEGMLAIEWTHEPS